MATDIRTVWQNVVMGLIVAIGLFFSLVWLSYSWIKILFVASIAIGCIAWLVSHGISKRTSKYFVLSLMVLGAGFTLFEDFTFGNAGYPPTYNPSEPGVTLSYPSILNVSLTEIAQSVQKTNAFSLFKIENPGPVNFEYISLSTTFPDGRIEITFYNGATGMGFGFISSDGYPYHASTINWRGQPISRPYTQQQTPEETLSQIDALGIQWFYNSALETYHDRTGTDLNITGLIVNTEWLEYGEYQGIALQLWGAQRTGNRLYDVFIAVFQPDGTLLYLNIFI